MKNFWIKWNLGFFPHMFVHVYIRLNYMKLPKMNCFWHMWQILSSKVDCNNMSHLASSSTVWLCQPSHWESCWLVISLQLKECGESSSASSLEHVFLKLLWLCEQLIRRNLRESPERDWAQAPWRGKDARSACTSSSTTHSSSSHIRTANAWGSLTHRNHRSCNTFVLIYATVWGDTLGSSTDWNRNLVFKVGYYWNKTLKHLPLTLALGGEKNVVDFWGKY